MFHMKHSPGGAYPAPCASTKGASVYIVFEPARGGEHGIVLAVVCLRFRPV